MINIRTVASSITGMASVVAISAVTLSAPPVGALVLTTGDLSYDVIVEETTFNELKNRDDFNELMPWFVDDPGEDLSFSETLAFDLATDASNQFILGNDELGSPGGFFGPFFVYAENSTGSVAYTTYRNNEGIFVDGQLPPDQVAFYAVVDLNSSAERTGLTNEASEIMRSQPPLPSSPISDYDWK